MPKIQLLGAVHDTNSAHAKQTPSCREAANPTDAAHLGHSHRVTTGIIDRYLELEGKFVMAGLERICAVRVG